MITETTHAIANSLYEILNNSGIKVTVKPGSILHDLMAAVPSLDTTYSSESDGVLDPSSIVRDSMKTSEHGIGDHNTIQLNFEKAIRATLQANNLLCRGTIIPHIERAIGIYESHLDSFPAEMEEPISYKPNTYHAIWDTIEQLDWSKYQKAHHKRHRVKAGFPDIPAEDLGPMMRTANSELSAPLAEWLNSLPSGYIKESYDRVFLHRKIIGHGTRDNHRTESGLSRDDAIIAWVLAATLPEMLTGKMSITLDEVDNECSKVLTAAGNAIYLETIRRKNTIENDLIYYDVEHKDIENPLIGRMRRTTVFVNNDVLKKYLSEGGTIESLYGAIIRNVSITKRRLLVEKQVNEEAYAKHRSMHVDRVRENAHTMRRIALSRTLKDIAGPISRGDTIEDSKPGEFDEDASMERISKYIKMLTPADTVDEFEMFSKAISRIWFPSSSSEKVLNYMKHDRVEGGASNMREAALIANIEIYADWILSQVEVSSK